MASERAGEDITIGASDQATAAYLALPASGRGPGVIVIQEWWGLVDHIRDVCDRLGREGFIALAPDLYRGERTSDPDAAGRLMMDLEIPRAIADLDRSVDRLLGMPGVEGPKVGAIGFCMGGQLALAAACEHSRIGAVVDCYGIHPNVEIDPTRLQAAVFGIFAENDEFIDGAAVQALETKLSDAGVRARFNTYVGVSHAFMNDSRPDVFDAPMADEAWNELLAFLRAELA